MKVQLKFICNKEIISGEFNPAMTVLDFLRNMKELKGTKEGCREGDCGACSVLVGELSGNFVNYKTINSCLLPMGDIDGKHVISIEGLNIEGVSLFQHFLVEEGGTQCGFCTPGFVVSFTSYLLTADTFETESAKDYLTGNLCRCTGHPGIIRAAEDVIKILNKKEVLTDRISFLVGNKVIPEYFKVAAAKLKQMQKPKVHVNYEGVKLIVSGGTDLFVQQGDVIAGKEINLISELVNADTIKIQNDECIISASATVADLESSTIMNNMFKDFKNTAELFGSKQIRNRATIGGNINNASPIGDMTAFFLSLNAKLILSGKSQLREVLLKDYYNGYKLLDRHNDEVVSKIVFKIPSNGYKHSFEKVCRRKYLDIASVNTSFYCEVNDNKFSVVHVSAGGVGPIPLYLSKMVETLNGKVINSENIKQSIEIALTEISPITDVRGSIEYKRLLLRNLLFAHFMKLFPEVITEEAVL
jgi:xanthine dehydrogenase small subunit